jgi:hypothetical protein
MVVSLLATTLQIQGLTQQIEYLDVNAPSGGSAAAHGGYEEEIPE